MTFRLRPEAEEDILGIALYIARDKPLAARRWMDRVQRACRNLGDMPDTGVARPHVRPRLRTFAVGNYLILYERVSDGVEIVRVIHGARRWEELL